MYAKRIIPCLDIKDGRVVKGVNFVDLRDAGDPVEVAAAYSREGADEVVFLDITATHEGRATVVDLAARVAEQLSIPFTVGGGIRTVEDFHDILRQGADKISINSAAIERPGLISEAAERFGSQCVVVAIDARRREGGGWDVYKHGGRLNTGLDALEWAVRAEDPADQHGLRRDQGGLRFGADRRGVRTGGHPCHRFRRRREHGAFCRGPAAGEGRCRFGRLPVPLS